MEKFQYHRKFSFTILQTSFIESGIIGGIKSTTPCIISRNKSRVAGYEQVEMAAVIAMSGTAAHVTSRFRVTENDVEAGFSCKRQTLFSEITSESPSKLSDTLCSRSYSRDDSERCL